MNEWNWKHKQISGMKAEAASWLRNEKKQATSAELEWNETDGSASGQPNGPSEANQLNSFFLKEKLIDCGAALSLLFWFPFRGMASGPLHKEIQEFL